MSNVLKCHQHTESANGTTGLRSIPIFVSCCFFLSGAAGLIYEVLWTRLLGLIVGPTTYYVALIFKVK